MTYAPPYRKSLGAKIARKIAYKGLGVAKSQGPFATKLVANKALSMASYLMKQNNSEHKVYDYVGNSVQPTTAGTGFELINPAQGTAYNQRIGDTIKIRSMAFRAQVVANNAGGDCQQVRIIIVKVKEPNGWSNTLSNILQFTNNAAGQIVSPKNYDKRFDTKILMDRKLMLVKGGREGVQIYKKFHKLGHVKFQAGTTSTENASYFMYILTDQLTNLPYITFQVRTTYVDN